MGMVLVVVVGVSGQHFKDRTLHKLKLCFEIVKVTLIIYPVELCNCNLLTISLPSTTYILLQKREPMGRIHF